MAPKEKTQKRGRGGSEDNEGESKKRRSDRLSQKTLAQNVQLPSPVTIPHQESSSSTSEAFKEGTATPPEGRPSQLQHRPVDQNSVDIHGISSPPSDTQAFSQFVYPTAALSEEVQNEAEEGVYGYLLPLDQKYGKCIVLKKRNACPMPDEKKSTKSGNNYKQEEEAYEQTKLKGIASGGYLIGRHPEADLIIDDARISNHQDEISVLDQARFVFRYPKNRETSAFLHQYTLLEKLGKGHFAEVFLCVEKSTGIRFAVKIFTKQPGVEERSKTEGLQQEIAVLMGVSHPNLLCLKDTFDEQNAVYLVLELAAEGELFNWIVMKQKLTEEETRKIFIQLFQAIKYLHDRGIVHRDIKPENILLTDKDLHIKVADFGLAKIIGEESFTTTLCGTPSYVAPEILEDSRNRRYTRAVDIWSLGVVLYICLCGFPPFSDELNTRDNPYSLTQQIKTGRFDYPSPYWDSVGDPALDLIDRMLTVDVKKRYTIDDCLEHPWTRQKQINLKDSTDGLVGGIENLDFSKRKLARERTLLSSINDVKITRVIDVESSKDSVKVYVKNPESKYPENRINNSAPETTSDGIPKSIQGPPKQEETPADARDPNEFMALGGKGDQELFGDEGSIYSKETPVK
ncbi:unnamed protein product [Diplocarpon coronariae]|nr:hypothetical protein JHW43_005078 [Diplocarpon mali]